MSKDYNMIADGIGSIDYEHDGCVTINWNPTAQDQVVITIRNKEDYDKIVEILSKKGVL